MPIYAYRCTSCGHAKDVLQRISDPLLSDCPACGAATFTKQVTAAGFQLKGSGWYVTDFRGGNGAAKADGADPGEKTGDKSAEKAADKTGEKDGDKGAGKGAGKGADKPAEKAAEKPAAAPAPAPASSAPAASGAAGSPSAGS